MNIVLLGLLYSENSLLDAKKYSKYGLQMAPHIFQTTLINGFNQLDNINLSVLNISPIGSYPRNYKKLMIRREKWDNNNIQIGYINLPYVKHIEQELILKREIEKLVKKYAQDDLYIIAYHTYEPFLNVIKSVKKRYPSIKSCLIVTDCVPGRGDMEKYMTSRAIKAGNRIVESAKYIDCFALLTKHLAEALEIGEKPYVITECICDETQPLCNVNDQSHNKCLYTGSVNVEYNICELADAFALMDNAELWICGNGSGREYVEQMTQKYPNIKYLGFLSQEELKKYRDECDFLINPRKPTGTYTKYSFPSKTAEYMISGKPVIMYKLEGIPDEYDQYLNYLSSETSEEIKNELEAIFSMDYGELTIKGLRAREFIISSKNSKKQAEKIISGFGSTTK